SKLLFVLFIKVLLFYYKIKEKLCLSEMTAKNNLYKKKIINNLYFSKLLSCAEISNKIEKSLSLTTKILNELVKEGYVVETGHAPSSGGRRPQMYALRPDFMYTVAVAMDQYITRLAVMDMNGN